MSGLPHRTSRPLICKIVAKEPPLLPLPPVRTLLSGLLLPKNTASGKLQFLRLKQPHPAICFTQHRGDPSECSRLACANSSSFPQVWRKLSHQNPTCHHSSWRNHDASTRFNTRKPQKTRHCSGLAVEAAIAAVRLGPRAVWQHACPRAPPFCTSGSDPADESLPWQDGGQKFGATCVW